MKILTRLTAGIPEPDGDQGTKNDDQIHFIHFGRCLRCKSFYYFLSNYIQRKSFEE